MRLGHHHLEDALAPEVCREVPRRLLEELEAHFHEVIMGRVEGLIDQYRLRLPPLEPLLELKDPEMWFPVPGMYGGFHYRLEHAGDTPLVVAESWCRVSGGSGQRPEIDPYGSKLVGEGFV